MKILFSKKRKHFQYLIIVDKERMIFSFGDGKYYDRNGNLVPKEDSFVKTPPTFRHSDDPWNEDWIEYEGLEEKLIAESTIVPVEEVVDLFGNYGFKNKAGKFVIEPQYAFAYNFTCGLAAVNLNRTWAKDKNGRRWYENHWGYIDSLGWTVIPFAFRDAHPFNKYGVAYVETRDDDFLIDTKGNRIPGTENLSFSRFYDYEDRFFEFTNKDCNPDIDEDDLPLGVYDTKERKILLEATTDGIIEWSEDFILVYELAGSKYGKSDFRQSYINSKGERLYPWLDNKGFAKVEKPNKSLVSVVSIVKFTELEGKQSGTIGTDGKIYKRDYIYGLYSSKEKFIIPLQYSNITEIGENIFSCKKGNVVTVIELEENDY